MVFFPSGRVSAGTMLHVGMAGSDSLRGTKNAVSSLPVHSQTFQVNLKKNSSLPLSLLSILSFLRQGLM